jgi:hypothetical protein
VLRRSVEIAGQTSVFKFEKCLVCDATVDDNKCR